jgi:hypothetical protein
LRFRESETEIIELTLSPYPIPINIGNAIRPVKIKVKSEVMALGSPELRRFSRKPEMNKPGTNARAEINKTETSSFLIFKRPMRLLRRYRATSELDKYPMPNETAIPTVIKRIGRTK